MLILIMYISIRERSLASQACGHLDKGKGTHGSNPIRIVMLHMLLYGLAYIYTRNVCTSVCKLKCKGSTTMHYINMAPTWPVNIYNHCHGSCCL